MITNPTYQHYSSLIAAQICSGIPACVDKVTQSIIDGNTNETFEAFYLPKMKLSIASTGIVRNVVIMALGLFTLIYLANSR